MTKTIVLSVNTSWNIVNFRTGLVRALRNAGYTVVAVTPVDEHTPRLADLGVKHIPITIDNKGVSPRKDLRLLRDYWRILRQVKPVAFLGWTIKPNVFGSLAAHALGIPTINNVSGLGTAFIRDGLLTRIVSTLYRTAFSRSKTVFFQNRYDRALFVDKRLVSPSRTALLPGSGVDVERFAPAGDHGDADRPFAFLLVARLMRDKGVLEYVAAAQAVRRRHPTVRFQILGFLDVANRTAITREEMDAWTVSGLIDYLGHADDVRAFITAADCVVLPSYREGLPRSLLEAAALAKPLIATDVPGCTEIARAGENALLCRVRDPQSLAAAMEEMLTLSLEQRAALGQHGREIVVSEFDERIVADSYIDALRRVLG